VVELKRRRAGSGEVFQISGARESLSDDVRIRQRNYAISMGIRTLCVILAVVLWHVQTVVAGCALVGGLLLPWIAVTVATAGRSPSTHRPPSFVPGSTRNVLGPGTGAHEVDGDRTGDDGDLPQQTHHS
jgi:Flp pilus assembly protein TadB